MSSGIRDKF